MPVMTVKLRCKAGDTLKDYLGIQTSNTISNLFSGTNLTPKFFTKGTIE